MFKNNKPTSVTAAAPHFRSYFVQRFGSNSWTAHHVSARVFQCFSSTSEMATHHVQEAEVSSVAGLREGAGSGHGRVSQSEEHRRYP